MSAFAPAVSRTLKQRGQLPAATVRQVDEDVLVTFAETPSDAAAGLIDRVQGALGGTYSVVGAWGEGQVLLIVAAVRSGRVEWR